MKAILVIDLDDENINHYGVCVYHYTSRQFVHIDAPLKPMPEKYIERDIEIKTERDVEVCTHGITLGRNLLIEELEK